MRAPRQIVLPLLALVVGACATPAQKLDLRATRAGIEPLVIRGTEFHHRVYRQAGNGGDIEPLHVYLEGDGLPWATPTRVARDPHPRRPLAFELMRRDPATALYLGRPCYARLAAPDPCPASLWTDERYSERIVASLEAALRSLAEPLRPLVLIGYSGGGVLAMLLAERLETTVTVVTLAANLDVAAWTTHHGFTPLTGSLDPAKRPPLRNSIRQWHLVGDRDINVPPAITRSVAERQENAEVVHYPDLDHACCWTDVWTDFLGRLKQ